MKIIWNNIHRTKKQLLVSQVKSSSMICNMTMDLHLTLLLTFLTSIAMPAGGNKRDPSLYMQTPTEKKISTSSKTVLSCGRATLVCLPAMTPF